MASNENRTDSTSRKMLPHFKSTNCFDSASHSKPIKIRRDMSTVSNYYVVTEQKNSDHHTITPRPDSKSLIDALPDINSKHRAQKRSSFLEMWLEEALDPQEGKGKSEGQVEVEKTGPLRTVQKFEIDKKYLKSQNISGDVVDKLYNSLYVYTYGINNTFSQLLNLTKTSQHAERKIINSFWKAFVKLLQGCTSYRTAFQVIEQTYQKQAMELRQNFAAKEAVFREQRNNFETEIAKLTKRISEQSNTISKLQSDYNIAQSSLHLTDQAFNDEVGLRLKFQQKVNAVFTSYEQIRIKYEKLLHDLRIKGEDQIVSRQTEIGLRAQLEQTEIRIIQLNRQLARQDEVIGERDRQIQVKRQQIYELTGTLAELNQKRDENEEHVRRIIIKLDHFRQQNDHLINEMTIRDTQVNDLTLRIKRQQIIIDDARNANERVYEKYQNTGKLLGDFNAERLMLQSQAREALSKAEAAKQAEQEAVKKRVELQDQVGALEYNVKILEQQITVKGDCLLRNVELIQNLQAVKDKFQRMYNITTEEKIKMEVLMNESVRLKEIFQEQMKGMRMLLESKGTELDEANNKLDNERDVFRSKISSLREEIATKQSQILDFHNKQLQDQETVTKATERMKIIEIEKNTFMQQKLKLQADIIQKELLLREGVIQRDSNRQIFKELNSRLEEISKQQLTSELNLSNKTSVLEQMRGRTDKEKDLLRKLLQTYREDREKKTSYVHPMIYEDFRMQVDRNTCKIASITSHNEKLQQQIVELNQKIEELQSNITILKSGLLKSEAENEKKKQIIVTLQKNKKDLEGLIAHLKKESSQNLVKHQASSAKYEKALEEQKKQISKMNQQLQFKKKVIKTQNETIDKLQDQKKIQNIHHMAQEDELATMKTEISKLKQQLASFKRADSKNSARTQLIKRKSTLKDQERETLSKGQERDHLETPKISNHQDTYRSQDALLKPIQEASRKRQESPEKTNYVQVGANKIDVRPSTVDRQAQTETRKEKEKDKDKDKPKFSHSFKFEQARQNVQSYGCQVDLLPSSTHNIANSNTQVIASHSLHKPRIEGQQFKRALKLTYMRR